MANYSNGWIYNNPGNIHADGGNGYGTANPWQGITADTYQDSDGFQCCVFSDYIFGLRALMIIVINNIKNGSNLYNFVVKYSGLSNSNSINTYLSVINSYLSEINQNIDLSESANSISSYNPDNDTVIAIAKGIVQNEIAEYSQLSDDDYVLALSSYANNTPHIYDLSFDNRNLSNSTGAPGSTTQTSAADGGNNLFLLAGTLGIVIFLLIKNKKKK